MYRLAFEPRNWRLSAPDESIKRHKSLASNSDLTWRNLSQMLRIASDFVQLAWKLWAIKSGIIAQSLKIQDSRASGWMREPHQSVIWACNDEVLNTKTAKKEEQRSSWLNKELKAKLQTRLSFFWKESMIHLVNIIEEVWSIKISKSVTCMVHPFNRDLNLHTSLIIIVSWPTMCKDLPGENALMHLIIEKSIRQDHGFYERLTWARVGTPAKACNLFNRISTVSLHHWPWSIWAAVRNWSSGCEIHWEIVKLIEQL